jgi:KTSC domain-containing protein
MEVKFKDGTIYQYHGVPEGKHLELMQAPSKGAFLHQEIKGKYPHKKKSGPPKT